MACFWKDAISSIGDHTVPAPLIFIVAGEPSGDVLGAGLMRSLINQTGGHVRFAGVGGPEMEAEGFEPMFPMTDLAVTGYLDVLLRLATILRRIRQAVAAVRTQRPAVVVTVDSQEFAYQFARRLYPAPCPVIQYVAPTVWLWKSERTQRIAGLFDRLLLLFPFEKPWWDAVSQDAVFVGHRVSGLTIPDCPARERARILDGRTGPIVLLMPGSRDAEIRNQLPLVRGVAERLAQFFPEIVYVVPTVEGVADRLRNALQSWNVRVIVEAANADKRVALMTIADAAVAKLGSAALELAAAGTPHVVVGRADRMSAARFRRLSNASFLSLVNILADKQVTPEFIQDAFTVDAVSDAVTALLHDDRLRSGQCREFRKVIASLRHPCGSSSDMAAHNILEFIS